MPTDLWHFYERDLDRTNIKDFYNSLPSHLQNKFRKSISINIEWGNVLQGYRGPSHMCNNGSGDSGVLGPSNGLQEIRYWWGARKDLNCQIPVLGTAVFGLGRMVQHLDGSLEWSSIFFDSKTGECLSHDRNEAADQLHSRGCQLFKEKKYSEASEYFSNADKSCSSGYRNEQMFRNDRDRAHAEIEAEHLNAQGDELFRQGKYREAFEQYRSAYIKSEDGCQYCVYRANKEKAQVEIDAMELNSEGNNYFEQGRYSEACSKYREAYEKSQTTREKNAYLISKNKAQAIVDKLSSLETSWNAAWKAENDETDDREEEARSLFQKVSNEAEESLKTFSYVFKFQQYAALAALKIEGNQLFNEGLQSQQRGITLLQSAQELNLRQNYEMASRKFEEAKENFTEALKRFGRGAENDMRFVSCVAFVQGQIDEVILSIKLTDQQSLSSGLENCNVNLDSDAGAHESDSRVEHNYFEHL